MIPAYNCAAFLPDAIQSVLLQAGEESMQIEVVDDCSTDADIEGLVKRVGKGRVSYFRQEKNLGSLRNFETCINRAKGKYIHLLHGDDKLRQGFYLQMSALLQKHPEAGAAFCSWNYIDDEDNILYRSQVEAGKPGLLKNWLITLAEHPRIQYAAMVVKREAYEKLGSFYGVTYGEDWEMWARIARDYPVAYTPEILAEYREHSNSISSHSFLTGKNIRDISSVINIINSYLPKEKQKKYRKIAYKNYVYWAYKFAALQWLKFRNWKLVLNQTRAILKVYIDLRLLMMIMSLAFRICLRLIYNFFKRKIK